MIISFLGINFPIPEKLVIFSYIMFYASVWGLLISEFFGEIKFEEDSFLLLLWFLALVPLFILIVICLKKLIGDRND